VPKNLDVSMLDGIVTATTDESMDMARRLAKEEGIFCGVSSGANVAGAIKLANAHPELKVIVTLICDTGQRYFSTELCGNPKHVEIPERDHPMDPYTTKQLNRYQEDWEIID
jgi:cysteine synthase A